MKQIILILAIFLTSLNAFSQTDEEWNYLTKGYKIQVESGLDMKKGYSFVEIPSIDVNPYKFDFNYLVNPNGDRVAISVVCTHKNTKSKWYTAVPMNNNSKLQEYYNTIFSWSREMLAAYCYSLSIALGETVRKPMDIYAPASRH